jgi:hypothetical protein
MMVLWFYRPGQIGSSKKCTEAFARNCLDRAAGPSPLKAPTREPLIIITVHFFRNTCATSTCDIVRLEVEQVAL